MKKREKKGEEKFRRSEDGKIVSCGSESEQEQIDSFKLEDLAIQLHKKSTLSKYFNSRELEKTYHCNNFSVAVFFGRLWKDLEVL